MRHRLQAGLPVAVELGQSLQAELSQHPQSRADIQTPGQQRRVSRVQAVAAEWSGRQQRQFIGVAAVQALHKTRIDRQIILSTGGQDLGHSGLGKHVRGQVAGHGSG